jgi:Probable Zinc-ribbon domain/Type III restriction enzyme, res subunit
MDNASNVEEAAKWLSQNQKSIIKSLFQEKLSLPAHFFDSDKTVVLKLQDRGLVEIQNEQVSLTALGSGIAEYWQRKLIELKSTKASDENKARKQQILEKSNQLLELYKQGLSYQAIANQHEISQMTVMRMLKNNPTFHEYLEERKEAVVAAEREKKERTKQKLYSRNLVVLYPERVSELWDSKKNGDLKPEDLIAGSSQHVWWKCPIDGHSWKKKPGEITKDSWLKSGNSGCPVCAGKRKKTEKQPTLTKVYSELIKQYWDYEKNRELDLDPEKLTLASNRKAWFKCPNDGNEWQATIASVVNQQWSKGNAGCRVCNGTAERKRGEWVRGETVASKFPNEVAKYWFYEANNKLEIDPMKLTIGSSKEAFFKCPIDGHEWVTSITAISRGSWQKGNSGCPACRGFVAIETTSLTSTYPDYVDQYWDYEKNNELGIYPNKFTRGSQKEAWFKCPIDGYEWKTRIGSITKSSWSQGNNGCARCGSGWTLEAIRQFVASLEVHVPNLTQAELYKIFEQSGVLDTTSTEGLKIVKGIIKGKLSGQKLRDVLQGKEVKISESELGSNDDLKSDAELQVFDAASLLDISEVSQAFEDAGDSLGQIVESNELPKVKVQNSLEFLSSKVVASADREAIDFFIASRCNQIWGKIFEDESAVEAIEAFTGEGYGRQVRDQLLDEYNQAQNMSSPEGWAFRVNGKITPPNLMQKLAAVRLRSQKRMLNLSLTGTGKTIGGILSSRIIDAHLTVIICPLDTIENWHGEIKQVFPDSRVTTKNFNPYWMDIENGHNYIILNHEMFQQPSTSAHIRQLLERYQIDFIIVDEIHRCKQRKSGDEPSKQSKRRQNVEILITNAAKRNPDLHVLGMSATPVINNLKEGKSLVELVTSVRQPQIGEKATINNCMRLHQAFVTLGIRSKVKPKLVINRVTLPVNCTQLVDEIRLYRICYATVASYTK